MATAAKIEIQLEAQTAQLKKGFNEATGAINKMSAGLSGNVAAGMAKFHVGLLAVRAALGAVSGAVNGLLAQMAELDKTQKFADRLGASADALTVLGFAAEQTGVSSDTMNMALQRMTRRVAEAAAGTGEAKDAIAELGLNAQRLNSLSLEDRFAAIADAMGTVTNHSDKVRLAFKLFDSEGVALVNTLAAGSDGLNEFAQQAADMGILVGDSRAGVEAANDAINRMKTAWDGFVQQVAIAVAPAIEMIANGLSEVLYFFNWIRGKTDEVAVAFKGLSQAQIAISKETAAATAEMEKQAKTAAMARKEATAMREELAKRGESVASGLRTPGEKFADEVKSLNELVKAGVITWDIYNRGVQKATDELKAAAKIAKEVQAPSIGAVTRATAAGFSAVQQANRDRREADKRHREQIEWLARIQAAILRSNLIIQPVGV